MVMAPLSVCGVKNDVERRVLLVSSIVLRQGLDVFVLQAMVHPIRQRDCQNFICIWMLNREDAHHITLKERLSAFGINIHHTEDD